MRAGQKRPLLLPGCVGSRIAKMNRIAERFAKEINEELRQRAELKEALLADAGPKLGLELGGVVELLLRDGAALKFIRSTELDELRALKARWERFIEITEERITSQGSRVRFSAAGFSRTGN
ncbi:hypothetical protein C4552_04005 [Candidatus Parcubacteria bacterium]|nr:MAG: hypothetical protein C4552_04005 [Candidatus Parcubacteria bacterium]